MRVRIVASARNDLDERYRLDRKTRLSYTLEAPSDSPLAIGVAALVAGLNAALEGLADP